MANEDYDFKGQLKYENFQFFFRKHWMRFLQPFFFTLPVGILVIILLYVLGQLVLLLQSGAIRTIFVFLTMVLIISFIKIFFLQVINFYFDLVIITDCRIIIIHKTIFLKNDYDAIDLTKIQDIAVEARGIIRNYLRYGKLVITLSTSSPPVTIQHVPDPHFLLEKTNRIKREHILQRRERRQLNLSLEEAEPKTEDYLQDVHSLNV